ncbi:MAG: hypothetical protein K8T10_13375 [Candidatus Eremiobacteraeota bacterium]|nr:hypothetical protein [Candidatus Eremiobacteraeota bacterium]
MENKQDIYGVGTFGRNIRKLKTKMCNKLEEVFPNATYVNHPNLFALERDKKLMKEVLKRNGISVAPSIPKDISVIDEELNKGTIIFVKARYGSMGKGITRLSKDKWFTNYKYDGINIQNHEQDGGWESIDITNNYSFLEKLLKEDIIVEKGLEAPDFKFDIRGVFVYGKLREIYGRTTKNSHITNLSQGGTELEYEFLEKVLGKTKLAQGINEMQKTCNLICANLIGVDLIYDNELNPYILEVNSFPGLGHGKKEKEIQSKILREVHFSIENDILMKSLN